MTLWMSSSLFHQNHGSSAQKNALIPSWRHKPKWNSDRLAEPLLRQKQAAWLCVSDWTSGHLVPKWTAKKLLIGNWSNYLVRKIDGYDCSRENSSSLEQCNYMWVRFNILSPMTVKFIFWFLDYLSLRIWLLDINLCYGKENPTKMVMRFEEEGRTEGSPRPPRSAPLVF